MAKCKALTGSAAKGLNFQSRSRLRCCSSVVLCFYFFVSLRLICAPIKFTYLLDYSVALGQEPGAGPDSTPSARHLHARDRRQRLAAAASGQHHQSLDHCGGYDARDAVVANVTVAVEPPSPTEARRHMNITSLPTSSTPPAAGNTDHRDDSEHRDDSFDDACGDMVKSNAKRRPQKSPLRRRVTSPEAVMRSSPQPEVTSEVGESLTRAAVEECFKSVANGQSYLLTLPDVTGSSPGQQSRRTSMCSNGSSLQPVSASVGPRRNSHTGLVQSFSSIPLTPPRPSSRRNSAVTYLPDMPQNRPRSDCYIIKVLINRDVCLSSA